MPVSAMFTTDLSAKALPSRGLFYSVLLHGVVVIASLYVPWSYWLPVEIEIKTAQSIIQEHEVLVLPDLSFLEPAKPAASSNQASISSPEGETAPAEAKAVRGLVYKGPQLIVSNPPAPDNSVQTILQPDLVRPPKLPAPLPLPSLVSVAPPKPVLAPEPPKTEDSHPVREAKSETAAQPIIVPRHQAPVETPQLPVAQGGAQETALKTLAHAAIPAPAPTLASPPPHAPKTEEHPQNVLVVDAIPVSGRNFTSIPPGELHGAFTVSPTPVPSAPGAKVAHIAGGGSELKGTPGRGVNKTISGSRSVRVGAGGGSGANKGKAGIPGSAKTGKNSIGQAHPAPGQGVVKGGSGGSGATPHGSGTGAGKGTDTVAKANSPFPGITIQGGRGIGITRSKPESAPKGQTSYGITIIASGSSGGGFKDFGVFRNEAAYTVYLDMADAGIPNSSWTLQYALSAGSASAVRESHGLLAPPYATSKTLPHFSPDEARRSRGSTIVVYGIIGSEGKFEDLRIMQSPDVAFNPLLLDALKKWTFRPAEMDGSRVPVKVLLGVPVNSIPQA